MIIHKLKIKPAPDFNRLEKVLKRNGIPDRVPFFELFSNIEYEVLKEIGKLPENAGNPQSEEYLLKQHINYMYSLGYDYLGVEVKNFQFQLKPIPTTMTDKGERGYVQAAFSTIANWEDFEKYAWPIMSEVDYSPIEKLDKVIPEGMKDVVGHSGVLENTMWLLGYENISYLLYDDEQLVKDVFEAVATRIIKYFDNIASFDVVGAIVLGEDMGFKTQTLLSPQTYRKYVFPWHKKIVETVHKHKKLIILHSCGNRKEIMEDIIPIGWDAIHSFEDEIEPVWEAKKKYGDRIAIVGGFDVDKISRMSPEEVRKHTRFLIEKCAPGGGWALGTGSSVSNYIPVENLLAMLEEGYSIGKYY